MVVPTRNEADGVTELVRRLVATLGIAHLAYELIFVDDSDDDTPEVLASLARQGDSIRVVHRPPGERGGGLGTALLRGFHLAGGAAVVVCDGDLQHPPETVPQLVAPILADHADVVAGTRYAKGAASDGLDGRFRRLASRLSGSASRAFVPASRGLTDPGGGFWAARTELLTSSRLAPTGFKSLLEVLARTPWERVVEVPYEFGPRRSGESNFSWREVLRFGGHLGRLTLRPSPPGSPPSAVPLRDHRPRPSSQAVRRWPLRAVARVTAGVAHLSLTAWAVIAAFAAFVAFEVFVTISRHNGPFLDEGIYIASGLRTLHGHGVSDGYLGWFAGSLVWPSLAGAGYSLAGLIGTRLIALILVTLGCAGSVWATRRLFGGRAALLATIMLLGSAPTLALAHLGVVDVVAVAGLGVTLGALGELRHTDRRLWLVVAAVAYAIGTVGKYPMAFTLPLVVLLLIQVRRRTAVSDLMIFFAIYGAVLGTYFLAFRYQLAFFLHWRTSNNPSFGVTMPMVAYEQLIFGVPWVLAVGLGIWHAGRGRRRLACILGSAILIFPAYHIVTVNSTGANKHVLFGFLVAAPIAGLGLSRLTRRLFTLPAAAAALVAVVAFDVGQMHHMDRSWPDESGVSNYLAAHMKAGQRLLAPDGWQVLPPIEGRGITDPKADMTDSYGFAHSRTGRNPCSFDWVVVNQNWNPLPESVLSRLQLCLFRPVYQESSRITNLGTTLRYVTWTAQFTVYERAGA